MIEVPQSIPPQSKLGTLNEIEKLSKIGCDSDGMEGPFFDAVDEEGEQDFDEDLLNEAPQTPNVEEDDTVLNNIPAVATEVTLTKDIIMDMNVKVLKEELKKRRVNVNGNKGMLQERLVEALKSGVPVGLHPVLESIEKESEE